MPASVVCITQHPTDGSLYYVTYNDARPGFSGSHPALLCRKPHTGSVGVGQRVLWTQSVELSSSAAADRAIPTAKPITYSWNFGDGSPVSTQANPTHLFSAAAGVPTAFVVTLTVTDSGGLSAQTTLNVSVNNTPPNVTITSPVDGSLYPAG